MRESRESSFGINLVSGVSVAIAVGTVALAFTQCHGAYKRVLGGNIHEETPRPDADKIVRAVCANGVDAQFGDGKTNTAHRFSKVMRGGEALAGFIGSSCSVSRSGTLPYVFAGHLLAEGADLANREKRGWFLLVLVKNPGLIRLFCTKRQMMDVSHVVL